MTSEVPRFEPGEPDRRPPALASPRGELPLRAVTVRAHVAGATADVEIEQTFDNPFDEVLEVSYVFPLPDLAAVTSCELRIGERVVAARLEERGAARETYARAIEEGRGVALAEQERPGVFTLTLGSLPPGERASVRFRMAYLLPREDGRHVLRFPLVAGERYVPGAPLGGEPVGDGTAPDTGRVADASRISPPRLAPGAERPALAIEVTLVHGALGIDEIESSLHAIRELSGGDRTIVRVVPGERLDRDFVLRFRVGGDAIRTQLVTCADAGPAPYRAAPGEGEATFQLTLVPPVARLRGRPRDLVLLLDRSGSMDGWKIVAARRALARIVDVLDDGDRFAVYAFGSETVACADLAADRLHAATAANRARAVEMLTGMSADGGTEMYQPLELAAGLLAGDPARDRWIVLVTDGQVANEDELVALVARAPDAKVLGLGIDDAVNASLLRRLAAATGGRVELVQQEAELEDALDRLHVAIAVPVIERVTVEAGGIVPGTVVPAGPIHVFPGVPLVVRGRCRGPLDAATVRGRIGREPFEATVRGAPGELPALRACWAREQLLALEDRFAAASRELRGALADEIIATSLRFGVLCRFTAFVAVDEHGPVTPPPSRSLQQPVEATLPAIAPRSTIPTTRWGSGGGEARNSRTMAGTLRGKLAYLSPEQARGLPVEPPHEVFGLAQLLWEMLTGRRLFRGDSDFETLTAITRAELPSPLLPGDLASLEPILRRALAAEPGRRHRTPGELAAALEAAAPALATPAEIAAWLAALDSRQLHEQASLVARAAAARPPARGYLVLARLEVDGTGDRFFAVRPGPSGNEPVVLERLRADLAEDPDLVELFLSEAALSIDGLVRIDDAGVDHLGGVFRARPFVHGLDLLHILQVRARAQAAVPAPIALAISCAAARALEAALHLPGGVGLIVRELRPSSLRISTSGRPIWTSIGVAPRADLTPPRRSPVVLALAPQLTLGPPGAAPPLPPRAWVSRFVVVPRTAPASVPAAPAPPPPPAAPRRRWLRWWRD